MQRPVIDPMARTDSTRTATRVTVLVEERDSGIYLRGNSKSQVNLWEWPAGSGEVYGYRTDGRMPAATRAAATPLRNADRPRRRVEPPLDPTGRRDAGRLAQRPPRDRRL